LIKNQNKMSNTIGKHLSKQKKTVVSYENPVPIEPATTTIDIGSSSSGLPTDILIDPLTKAGFIPEPEDIPDDEEEEVYNAKEDFTKEICKPEDPKALELLAQVGITSFVVTKDQIMTVFNNFIKEIPETAGYLAKEVVIHTFTLNREKTTIYSLLAAGTLPLDAILYLSLANDSYKEMFDIKGPMTDDLTMCGRLAERARAIFVSWACYIINRGQNPDINKDDEPIGLLKNKILKNFNIRSEQEIAFLSSSAPLSKFPISIMVSGAELSSFPKIIYHRFKLSPAGSKIMRYALIASSYEMKDPEPLSDLVEKTKTEYAINLYKVLKQNANNFSALLKIHPLYDNPARIERFSLKMTCVILYVLTIKGRTEMTDSFNQKKIKAFTKDKNIMPSTNQEGGKYWAILTDTAADFMTVTVDSMNRMLGI
jgi:hypothetical protein